MILFFDTETTGKIKNYSVKLTRDTVDNFPRVTQLASILYTNEGEEIGSQSDIIKPDGWTVPTEKFFIDNNMSTERCEREGISIKDSLNHFIIALGCAELLVAHNIAFDHPVLGAEMLRLGMKAPKIVPKFCTMISTAKYIPRNKWPKLCELYRFLFNDEMTEMAHDALGDVRTTAKCYFELKNRKLI